MDETNFDELPNGGGGGKGGSKLCRYHVFIHVKKVHVGEGMRSILTDHETEYADAISGE